jgi:branched-subunit amino acid ABC-type transport system permease component
MQLFFEQLTNGLAVGGIYALIALGTPWSTVSSN